MNTVTLVAERRGRILGFLYATLVETSARIMFLAVLPEYRRRGIGTALHQ
jgi:ribosomal protein S18 acetylase RimI-like enzyme